MKTVRGTCLAAVLGVYACAIGAGPLTGGSYELQDRAHAGERPGAVHWLGTDDLGRDRLVRLLYGARTSLVLAPAAALLATAIATFLGSAAALAGGRFERAALYLVDVVASTPWFFALLLMRSVLPLNVDPAVSVSITFAILGLLGWPHGVRPVAARSAAVIRSEFMRQARASGIGRMRLLRAHMVPNLMPVVAAHFWATLPVFILAEANLSLLGLGVAEPLPSLGNLMSEFRDHRAIAERPWLLAPAVLLIGMIAALQVISKKGTTSHDCT
ncbi:MAG: ABC transporter permease [Acidobacteriia bacterium]|nr:ABC transporter permease [Terriglobia bacterium]